MLGLGFRVPKMVMLFRIERAGLNSLVLYADVGVCEGVELGSYPPGLKT